MKEFNELVAAVDAARNDVDKMESHNNAAGTRVRKAMQDIKQLAQAIRNKAIEIRNKK